MLEVTDGFTRDLPDVALAEPDFDRDSETYSGVGIRTFPRCPQVGRAALLSRVVLVDSAQLIPDRSASITFDPIDTTSVQLAINGLTYSGPGEAVMTATLQTQPVGAAWRGYRWRPFR